MGEFSTINAPTGLVGKLKDIALHGHILLPACAGLIFVAGVAWFIRHFLLKGVRSAEAKALTGSTESQVWLGLSCLYGRNHLRVNYKKAAKWLRMAAAAGDATAQNSLGTLYCTGRGVPRDFGQAFKFYAAAAEQGDGTAQANLARLYYEGSGIERDDELAYFWARLASLSPDAERFSSMLKNPGSFRVFLESAAQRLLPEQQEDINKKVKDWRPVRKKSKPAGKPVQGKTDGQAPAATAVKTASPATGLPTPPSSSPAQASPPRPPKTPAEIAGIRKLAEEGNAAAQFSLGFIYAYGEGLPKNEAEAAAWFLKAGKARVYRAQCHLGVMYMEGKGLPADMEESFFWFSVAALASNDARDISMRDMVGKQLAPAQREAVLKRVEAWSKGLT